MKKLLAGLAGLVLLFAVSAHAAGPYLTVDVSLDAESYELSFPTIPLTVTDAVVDGIMLYDLSTWTHGHGWFSGTASFKAVYEVVDETTGALSTVERVSSSSPFRIKIPNIEAFKNYKIQQ